METCHMAEHYREREELILNIVEMYPSAGIFQFHCVQGDHLSLTLNMLSAAEECREPSGNFTLSREQSPCVLYVLTSLT